jgi:hypothetical protein
MDDFDPGRYGPTIAALWPPDRLMALDHGRPDPELGAKLEALDPERLLAPAAVRDAEMAAACLAGLWLLADDLDRSHRISQGLDSREGSYWHAIMHRREGDYGNAKYWFRRVGRHPIHSELARRAHDLARAAGDEKLELAPIWDPDAFVDACAAACAGRSEVMERCQRIQQEEWRLLFDHCHRRAIGAG